MTYVIYKSRLNVSEDTVNLMVQRHVDELDQWTENMRLCDEEDKVALPEEPQRENFETDETYTAAYVGHSDLLASRRQRYPGPQAHPEVDKAVSRSEREGRKFFTPDFRVVDDLPEPAEPETETDRLKKVYTARVLLAEHKAGAALITPARARLANIRAEDIQKADEQLLQSRPKADPGTEPVPVKEYLEAHRPAEDTAFLAQQTELAKKFQAISRWGAKALAEVEDLTEGNVQSWAMPPLN